MGLRRTIKLALIGRINTSIKKSKAIKQNSIHLLFLDIFVAIIDGVFLLTKSTHWIDRNLHLIDTNCRNYMSHVAAQSSYLPSVERSALPYDCRENCWYCFLSNIYLAGGFRALTRCLVIYLRCISLPRTDVLISLRSNDRGSRKSADFWEERRQRSP